MAFRAKPSNDVICLCIDVSHSTNLSLFLQMIALIDAYLVNPPRNISLGWVTKTSMHFLQGIPKVMTDLKEVAINRYCLFGEFGHSSIC